MTPGRTVLGMGLSVILAACSNAPPPILLFSGTGTSQNDVAAIEAILNQQALRYERVDSERLSAMHQSQIQSYRLLIVPGGNFVDMANGLTAGTIANVRKAVKSGMNYLGICAGGFLAGSFPAPYKGFDLTSGVKFGFYSAGERGIRKTAVRIMTADGSSLDQYWEDGPELSGWGAAVATYPDGKPAVAEGFSGNGWVILTGIHPEAPAAWRRELTFATPVSASNAYALTLIDAALNRKRLLHY
jgi:glutamine amidotransferase-like uncharacterized protein